MKKRILSVMLACTILIGSDGVVYATEMAVEQNQVVEQVTEEDVTQEEETESLPNEESALEEETVEEEIVEEEIVTQENEEQEDSEKDSVPVDEAFAEETTPENIVEDEQMQVETIPSVGSQKPAAPVLTMTGSRYDYVNLSWKALELPAENSGYYIYSIESGKLVIIAEFVRDAQGYVIYEYINGIKSETTAGRIAETSVFNYSVKNVVHNKQYQFQVAAYTDKSTEHPEEEQIGDLSNIITVTPKIQTPVLKSVTAKSYNTAEIIWQTTNDSPDGYEVYRKEDGTSAYQKIAVTKAGTYTDKTLTVGKKYSYKVRSIKTLSGGNTIYSDYTAQKDVKTTLAVTTVKAASYSYTSIRISWGKVDGASGYDIYRSTSKSGKYSKIAAISDGKTVKYTDKKLTTGNTYYYKLRAYYTSGKTKTSSSYSNISSAKVIPAAPQISSVSSANYNTLKIKWDKVSGADGYVLYCSTSENGKYEKVASINDSKTLSYTNKKLTTGKKYYYKVRAYRSVGKSKVYGAYSEVKAGTPVPAKATGLKAKSVNANKVKLTWNKVSGAKSYTIYRSTSPNGTYKVVKTGCTKTTYTNSKLKNGTKYYYKVAAVRGKTTGKLTNAVSAKAVSLSVNDSSITIQKGEKQKIKVTVSPKATVKCTTSNKKVAKVSSNGTVTGVSVGSAKITVKANGVTTTVQVKVVPTAPKVNAVSSVNYNTLKIQWKKVSGTDGYVLYRSTSKNGKYTKVATIKGAKTLSYKNTKLTTGKTYYYKIRAYQTVKKSKVYGRYSSVKSGTPKPAKVTGVKATRVNANKIKLTWSKVSGAKSYTIYRSTSKNGTYKAVKTGCTSTSYTNSGLKNGTTYYYKIAAVRGKTVGNFSSVVSAKAVSLSVSQSSITIQQGMSWKVTATASPKATVKWSSSNTKVAKVSSKGTITGVSAGSAKIYAKANGITKTITVKVKKRLNGIDVSKWQGEIDFNAVKKAGIDAVMIRIYNGYTKDPYFENNYKNAKAAGLNIGVYYYTYATTTQQAQQDARTVLEILDGRSLQYPIAIDMEDASLLNGLSNADRTDILWSFCSTIQNNSKYKYALYANLNWLNNYFENSRLAGMPIWIARYCDPSLGHRYTGAGNVFMWQYTSQGTIPGINGYVDMNFVY